MVIKLTDCFNSKHLFCRKALQTTDNYLSRNKTMLLALEITMSHLENEQIFLWKAGKDKLKKDLLLLPVCEDKLVIYQLSLCWIYEFRQIFWLRTKVWSSGFLLSMKAVCRHSFQLHYFFFKARSRDTIAAFVYARFIPLVKRWQRSGRIYFKWKTASQSDCCLQLMGNWIASSAATFTEATAVISLFYRFFIAEQIWLSDIICFGGLNGYWNCIIAK